MYSMYLNGEGIQVIHQPAAHTDGDTIVFFRRGDVIATGDIIDTTRFPFIDVKRGGTRPGRARCAEPPDGSEHPTTCRCSGIPDRTFLVPGHGHVYDKLDLLEYRDAITIVRDRVQDLIEQGQTLAQVKAANPTLGYRSQYGTDSGPWTTDMFVEVVYNELARPRKGRNESRADLDRRGRRVADRSRLSRGALTRSAVAAPPPPPQLHAPRRQSTSPVIGCRSSRRTGGGAW